MAVRDTSPCWGHWARGAKRSLQVFMVCVRNPITNMLESDLAMDISSLKIYIYIYTLSMVKWRSRHLLGLWIRHEIGPDTIHGEHDDFKECSSFIRFVWGTPSMWTVTLPSPVHGKTQDARASKQRRSSLCGSSPQMGIQMDPASSSPLKQVTSGCFLFPQTV